MRPCVCAEQSMSIHLAIEKMRESGQEVIPVVNEGHLVGLLTEAGILRYVGDGASPNDAVSDYMSPTTPILNRNTGAEALRQLEATPILVVVDGHDVVCGLVAASNFVGTVPEKPRPPMVGGMATPFGVYLTNGAVMGGKKGWYLVTTGFFLIAIFLVGDFLTDLIGRYVPETTLWNTFLNIVPFLVMVLAFRIHPIAGYHAAEHQVVHAIERDEEITPEVVARMPRVHPRCGTNLAVAAAIFSALAFNPWFGNDRSAVFLGLFFTIMLWKPLGSLAQYWITTKKANAKQIASAIEAAKELLANYEVAPSRTPSPFQRIYTSGLLHVMAGSTAALLIAVLIGMLTGVVLVTF